MPSLRESLYSVLFIMSLATIKSDDMLDWAEIQDQNQSLRLICAHQVVDVANVCYFLGKPQTTIWR